MKSTLGWAEIDRERKREIIEAIASGRATRGPVHLELDLTDRCNVDCYFCNQMDVRTTRQLPYERVVELIDELADKGLAAVRLSGGGEPLAHRKIVAVLDHLAARGVVVDNLTTNGALLGEEIAARLVRDRAREVVVSLNAIDAPDYARMMQVRPEVFDRVVDNVRRLVERRGDAPCPAVVVQFLLDRVNFEQLPRMYELGCSLGADRIAVNPVLNIPNERIDLEVLLHLEDFARLRPLLADVLTRDREAGLLQICFPFAEWNRELAALREEIAAPAADLYSTAPSYRETDNGWCFFGWYSTVVRGNGDLHPCCMLMNPRYEPLGNLLADGRSFTEHWTGPAYDRMREEMRDLFLSRGHGDRQRFRILKEPCTEPYLCFHKNRPFRGDEDFYRELGAALAEARKREISRANASRRAEPTAAGGPLRRAAAAVGRRWRNRLGSAP